MRGLPYDIDQLMWTIAESGDLAAADDFERRFPEWKVELESRMTMVRGLRDARPQAPAATPEIPRFVPKAQPAVAHHRVGWVVALSMSAVIAFGSYLYVVNLPPPDPVIVKPPVAAPNPNPQADPGPGEQPVGEPQAAAPTRNPNVNPPAPDRVLMPWELRHELSIEGAQLIDVLMLIADVTKLKLEVAPGMPNPEVSVSYSQKTGMEMLADLGRQHGFTPLDQGQGTVLIVPTTEGSNN